MDLDITLEEIIQKDCLIRPFVELTGQRGGYHWNFGRTGKWRDFLDSEKKHYSAQNTGTLIFTVGKIYFDLKTLFFLRLQE